MAVQLDAELTRPAGSPAAAAEQGQHATQLHSRLLLAWLHAVATAGRGGDQDEAVVAATRQFVGQTLRAAVSTANCSFGCVCVVLRFLASASASATLKPFLQSCMPAVEVDQLAWLVRHACVVADTTAHKQVLAVRVYGVG